jgi:hypothetical protein
VSPQSESPKRVPKASPQSESPKRVPKVSPQSKSPKRVPKASSQSEAGGPQILLNFQTFIFSSKTRNQVKIYWFFDVPHVFKLLRNHFIDYGFKLPSGTEISRDMLLDIFSKIETAEVCVAYKLTRKHLFCKKQDRQNVKLAAQLFSKSTASAIKLLEPDNEAMQELAGFISLMDDWFDVMNSHMRFDRKTLRCAYRENLEEQRSAIKKAMKVVKKMRRIGGGDALLPWQKGFLISSRAMMSLFKVCHILTWS